MSNLVQYDINKLCPSVSDDPADVDSNGISPGDWVSHIEDNKSWGMVAARSGDQALVLWSRTPRLITDINATTTSVQATTRKLRAKWSVEVAEDHNVMNGINVKERDE